MLNKVNFYGCQRVSFSLQDIRLDSKLRYRPFFFSCRFLLLLLVKTLLTIVIFKYFFYLEAHIHKQKWKPNATLWGLAVSYEIACFFKPPSEGCMFLSQSQSALLCNGRRANNNNNKLESEITIVIIIKTLWNKCSMRMWGSALTSDSRWRFHTWKKAHRPPEIRDACCDSILKLKFFFTT